MNPSNDTGSAMADQRIRVLVVDAAAKERETMRRFLAAWNFEPIPAVSAEEARKVAAEQGVSIAVIADPVSGSGTMALVHALRECNPGVETVLLAENDSASFATEAFRAGVYDCLQRPVEFRQLSRDLNTLREAVQRRMERKVWDRSADDSTSLGSMVGFSAPMQAVFASIRRFAQEESPVLITGLIGTGKEITARTLHALSLRAGQPLVVYRCCGVSAELAEAELFGTPGSGSRKPTNLAGFIEAARGGTLFLDEIGDLPCAIQRRLEKALRQMVEMPSHMASVRVLAATRFNLADLVAKDHFAAPLYSLLNSNVIHLPSLTERPEDIPLLCRHFLGKSNLEFEKQICGFSPAAERVLLSYAWPGNVRELENVIGRACLLADQKWIELSDLSITSALDQRPSRLAEWRSEAAENSATFAASASTKPLGKRSSRGPKPAPKG